MEAIPLGLALLISFAAGLVSFVSPCVLPLVPSYLSFITGMSLEDLEAGVDRRNTMVHATLFVIGFSLIFILLGTTASFLGQFLKQNEVWIARVGGAVIALFGLHLMGALRIAPLLRERRIHVQDKPAGHLGTLLVGMAFGAGWTPCLGPVLGGILTFAGISDSVGRGVGMLSAYSSGLAIPFLLSAQAMERFLEAFQRFRRFLPIVQFGSGVVMVVLGILLVFGWFTALTSWLYLLTPEFLIEFEYWMLEQGRGANIPAVRSNMELLLSA